MIKFLNLLVAVVIYSSIPTYGWSPPVGALLGGIAAAIGVTQAALTMAVVQIAASAALSQVSAYLRRKAMSKANRDGGITTTRKRTGGANSRTIMLGRYATAGSEVAPPYSRGSTSKTPNIFLTYVVALSDIPIQGINRLIINGEYVPITATQDDKYGSHIGGKYLAGVAGDHQYAFIRSYNGKQTTADAQMVSMFGDYPDRPWTSDMVGTGMAYAIITFRYNTDLFKGEPEVRYEIDGALLYDPRKDSSVGGSGTHRWANPNTWTITRNPLVMAYNIYRGIPLGDGRYYGVGVEAAELPLASWTAAMNICDEVVDGAPRYEAGLEVLVDVDEPADIIDDLLTAADAQVAEIGGVVKVRAGGPGLPVAFFEDADFIVNREQDFDPFPATNQTHNIINAVYPHPGELWTQHDAPAVYRQAEIDRDGEERPMSLSLNAVFNPKQAQRLQWSMLKDDQRHRAHNGSLGPYGLILEPLDVFSWTSKRNQYVTKLFDITGITENLNNLCAGYAFREVDPNDYSPHPVLLPDPVAAGGWQLPGRQAVPGFNVEALSILDKTGRSRRPVARVSWDSEAAQDVDALRIVIEHIQSGRQVAMKTVAAPGRVNFVDISEGLLPEENYRCAGIFVVDRPVQWTSWFPFTTLPASMNDKVTEDDFSEALRDKIQSDMEAIAKKAGVTPVDVLPASGTKDQIVMLIPPGRLYRWDATANGGAGGWTENLYAGIPPGAIDATHFAQGIEPNKIIAEGQPLPTVKSTNNIVWNGALYTWDGTKYTTPSFSLTPGLVKEIHIDQNAVTVGKIVNGAITEAKLGQNAVTRDKILAGAVDTLKLADLAITEAKVALGAITGTKIADTAVGTVKIADSALTAIKLANNAVTRDKIINDAISELKIAAGAVTDAKIAGLSASKVTGQLADSQIAEISAAKLAGTIASAQIANNAITDAKIAGMSASKVSGQLTDAQIAGVTAAKLAGQITSTQITDNAVTTAKINAGAVTATEIFGGAVTADKIASNAVTAVKIFAGSVETAKLAAGAVEATKIAAGAVIADKIAADAVTAVKIRAGAIDATKIVAGAVITEKIATDAVTAVKVLANAITTAKINAGAVTATEIATGAVTADKIVANAITADKIAANAITAAKISAGAIGVDQLAAKSIVASKLAIMDLTNRVPDDQLQDPASWYSREIAAYTHYPIANHSGLKSVGSWSWVRANQTDPLAENYLASVSAFPVTPGEELFLSGQTWRVGGTKLKVYLGLWYLDKSGTNIVSRYYPVTLDNANVTSADRVGSSIVPVGAFQARYVWYIFGADTDATSVHFGSPTIRLKSGAELIVDGAIVADKIATDAVTAGKVLANSITTAKIAALAVTAAEIATNAVTADKIIANAITTAKINAGAVTATEIASNAVTTIKILADSVTTAKILAGSVTVNELASNSVTAVKIATNAVTADAIAANAVEAGAIKAGAITADKIGANAVTAAKIQAGAVGADQIAAGAIVSKHILISNFENIFDGMGAEATSPLVRQSGASGWDGTITYKGQPTIIINGTDPNGTLYRMQNFPVNPGDQYFIRFFGRRNGTWNGTTGNSKLRFGDQDGNLIMGIAYDAASVPNSATFAELSGYLTIPDGVRSVGVTLTNDGTTGWVRLGGFEMRLRNKGELIVDGAITANKIMTDAVTANAIAAGAIVSTHIAAGAVTATKIDVISLSAISANMGTITAGLIRSGTSGGRFQLDTTIGLRIWDDSGNLRVILGKIS